MTSDPDRALRGVVRTFSGWFALGMWLIVAVAAADFATGNGAAATGIVGAGLWAFVFSGAWWSLWRRDRARRHNER